MGAARATEEPYSVKVYNCSSSFHILDKCCRFLVSPPQYLLASEKHYDVPLLHLSSMHPFSRGPMPTMAKLSSSGQTRSAQKMGPFELNLQIHNCIPLKVRAIFLEQKLGLLEPNLFLAQHNSKQYLKIHLKNPSSA
ncbi:hypothetical protein SLE2022_011790 [Rubroshorea leprosula]